MVCGWKHGSAASRTREHVVCAVQALMCKRVALHFGFQHIKRVEGVTNHPGALRQVARRRGARADGDIDVDGREKRTNTTRLHHYPFRCVAARQAQSQA